jgi:7-cyano-7-deazaguanine synthase
MAKIILLSGGMDSLISYRLFHPDAIPVFVHTGARYASQDLERARHQAPELHEVKGPHLVENDDGVVPHRNAALLCVVANRFDAEEIVVSAPRGELIWDQQPRFYRAMETALNLTVTNPLHHLTKTEAVAAWLRSGRKAEDLLASRSCYSTTSMQCGRCPACVKRWIALRNNGLSELYVSNVRQHAIELAKLGTWRDVLRYGLRPSLEAWRAVREP